MAIPFLAPIDMNKNEVRNLRLQNLTSNPQNPASGQFYYNSSNGLLYYWNGSAWVELAASTGTNITDVIGGQGLSNQGGNTNNGAVTLNVLHDDETITLDSDGSLSVVNGGIGTTQLASNAVTEIKIANNAVTTNKINNQAVTLSKIQNINTSSLLGRMAAGNGVVEQLTVINDLNSATATNFATAQSIKTYVDNSITSLGTFRGDFNVAVNSNFPGSNSTPVFTNIKLGDYWYATSEGTIHGITFNIGDALFAKVNNPSNSSASDWFVLESNRGQATTSSKGVVFLATNTEVQDGVNTTKAVVPSSLASLTSTTSRRGLVRLATDAETQTGTDNEKAVTPQSLSSRTATTARTGVIQLATQGEVDAGSNNTKAVTPATLSGYVGGYAQTIGNGTNTSFDITHNLGTEDVIVAVYQTSAPKQQVFPIIEISNSNQIRMAFSVAPANNEYRVVVKK